MANLKAKRVAGVFMRKKCEKIWIARAFKFLFFVPKQNFDVE